MPLGGPGFPISTGSPGPSDVVVVTPVMMQSTAAGDEHGDVDLSSLLDCNEYNDSSSAGNAVGSSSGVDADVQAVESVECGVGSGLTLEDQARIDSFLQDLKASEGK